MSRGSGRHTTKLSKTADNSSVQSMAGASGGSESRRATSGGLPVVVVASPLARVTAPPSAGVLIQSLWFVRRLSPSARSPKNAVSSKPPTRAATPQFTVAPSATDPAATAIPPADHQAVRFLTVVTSGASPSELTWPLSSSTCLQAHSARTTSPQQQSPSRPP
jgi:hypothetical protein